MGRTEQPSSLLAIIFHVLYSYRTRAVHHYRTSGYRVTDVTVEEAGKWDSWRRCSLPRHVIVGSGIGLDWIGLTGTVPQRNTGNGVERCIVNGRRYLGNPP